MSSPARGKEIHTFRLKRSGSNGENQISPVRLTGWDDPAEYTLYRECRLLCATTDGCLFCYPLLQWYATVGVVGNNTMVGGRPTTKREVAAKQKDEKGQKTGGNITTKIGVNFF